jgi:hypothetical protein
MVAGDWFFCVDLSVGLCVVQDGLLVRGGFSVGTGVLAEWAKLVPDCIVLFFVCLCFH